MKSAGKRLLSSLLALLITAASASAVSYMPDATAQQSSAAYWIDQQAQPDAVLLTAQEIAAVNERIIAEAENTKVNDLFHMPLTVDTVALLDAMCKFQIKSTYYIGAEPVSASYYESARQNMRDSAAASQKMLRYGLVCRNTDLKAYPFADILSDAPDAPEYDAFQSNKVLAGDGIVIAAQSRDRQWYFGYTRSFTGWLRAADVAVCASKQEWSDYLTAPDFLVVTGSKVVLETSVLNPVASGQVLTIGTRLPLSTASAHLIDGRTPYGNYIVKMPARSESGSCIFREVAVPVNRDVHAGYLTYTQRNLLTQLFKEQGDRYGWGGMLNADDCTSFVVNVYRCFGIYLPNGRWMQFVPELVVTDLSGYSDAQKAAEIAAMPAGSILQFHGHVTAYLGQSDEQGYVISALGSADTDGSGTITRIHTVTVNSLGVKRANGNTWLHELYFALTVRTPSFNDIAGSPAEDAILSLARANIVRGTDAGIFSPDAPVTRLAAVKLLSRAWMLEEAQIDALFADEMNAPPTAAELNRVIAALWTAAEREGEPTPLAGENAAVPRGDFCLWLDAVLHPAVADTVDSAA